MEWLRRLLGQIRELWGKWKPVQKIILLAIVGVVVIVGVRVTVAVGGKKL